MEEMTDKEWYRRMWRNFPDCKVIGTGNIIGMGTAIANAGLKILGVCPAMRASYRLEY